MTHVAALVTMCALAFAAGPGHAQPKRKSGGAMRFTASAYCDEGTTKSGMPARQGIVAADPRVLPIGTVVQVRHSDGRTATYVVADTGAAVKGRHLDIFMPSCAAAKRFGRRSVTARVTRAARAAER
jgi:3D (Asp-Asp-Asp) domain-containing protein